MSTPDYGDMNLHAIGAIMHNLVRDAIVYIRRNRTHFNVHTKPDKDGKSHGDVYTNVDAEAQLLYVNTLRNCFPSGYGILAEENDPRLEVLPKSPFYFSIDPIDGTKAFIRRQSHGITSMISLSHEDTVIASYIGDVMTQEVYGFHAALPRAYRYYPDNTPEELRVVENKSLRDQILLLEGQPYECSSLTRMMAADPKSVGLFRKMEINSGGIGFCMARLWKGEAGAMLLTPSLEAPWDFNPVLGISKKMGFVFIDITADGSAEEKNMPSLPETVYRHHELLIIHRSRLTEYLAWHKNIQNIQRALLGFDPRSDNAPPPGGITIST